MGELRCLQREMARALVNPADADAAAVPHLRRGAGPSPAARLAIYRNNIEQARINALRVTYPVVLALIGEDCFRQFARTFARGTPSLSGNLEDYGGGFSEFLAAHEDFHRLAWLADVAALEWLLHEVHQAAPDEAPLHTAWCEIAGADPDTVQVSLSRSCRLFASIHPVLQIWQFHQSDAEGASVQLDAGPARLVIVQHEWHARIHELGCGEFAFARACEQGSSLTLACEAALAAEPRLDLGQCLNTLVRLGALGARVVSASTPEEEVSHAIC